MAAARAMGITEGDGAYGYRRVGFRREIWPRWRTCLMDARTTPQQVATRGIARLTPARVQEIARQGKTVRLVSRGRAGKSGVTLRVRAEVMDRCDILAGPRSGNHELDPVSYRPDGNFRHCFHRAAG